MKRVSKISTLTLILTLMVVFSSYKVLAKVKVVPKNAIKKVAIKKTVVAKVVIPKVVVNSLKKSYNKGEIINISVFSTGYVGKIQYKVLLRKLNSNNVYHITKGYTASINAGGNYAISLPLLFQEGGYKLEVYVKRTNAMVNYDGLSTESFEIAKNIVLTKSGQVYKLGSNNIISSGDLYIKANNISVKNLKLKGIIIVDPGKDGNANLENVVANGIIIKSGGKNSIHFNNVIANKLTLDNTNNETVRVETKGNTAIKNTEVKGSSILEVSKGSFGNINITDSNSEKNIEFRGRFENNIIMSSGGTITVPKDSDLTSLKIATINNENVKLQGNFKNVEVAKPTSLELLDNSNIIEKLKITSSANLIIAKTSSVAKLEIATINKLDEIKLKGNINTLILNSEGYIEILDGSTIEQVEIGAKVNLDIKANVDIKAIEDPNKSAIIKTPEVLPPSGGILPPVGETPVVTSPIKEPPVVTPPVVIDPPVVTPPTVVVPPVVTPPAVVVPPVIIPPVVVVPPVVTPPVVVVPPVIAPPVVTPPVTTPRPVIEYAGMLLSKSASPIAFTGSGYEYSMDLSGESDNVFIQRLCVTVSSNCNLTINGVVFNLIAHVQKQIKVLTDFGFVDNGSEGAGMISARNAFGTNMSFNGQLNDGINSAITVKINIKLK